MTETQGEETSRFDCRNWLWLGLLALGLLALIAYNFGKSSKKNLHALTNSTAQEALAMGGFGFAQAEVKGGTLVLTGTAPNESAKMVACAAARKALADKKLIGLPGVVGAISCNITFAGEPAKPVAKLDAKASTCQADLNAIAASGTVNFAKSSAQIQSGKDLLDKVSKTAIKCADYSIEVAGHTDTGGEAEMNMRLSSARASAVRDYLVSKGVDKAQLSAKGYGETKPLVEDHAVQGVDNPERAKNRRIEFTVSAKQ